jgi:hypothetical protein
VRRVLDLDPVPTSAFAIGAIASLRDDAFEPDAAGDADEIRTGFALLVVGDEDSFDAADSNRARFALRSESVSRR